MKSVKTTTSHPRLQNPSSHHSDKQAQARPERPLQLLTVAQCLHVFTTVDIQNPLQKPKFALFADLVDLSGARYGLCSRLKTMKPRILIVDDDSQITQQLYWTLCDEYDVVTANDLQTAIRRATFYKPDICILDLQMP